MQILNVSIVESLTNQVWEKWKSCGYTEQPYALTWLEVNHLANHFLKLCREQNRDYREFDFSMLLDHKLNYEENRAEIENQLGGLSSEDEKTQFSKLKDYISDEKLKEFSEGEKTKIQELETTSKNLNAKINKVLKSQETQLGTEQIREEIEQVKQTQSLIIAKLEGIPNLDKQVEAMLQSPLFKDLGKALQPIVDNKPPQPVKPAKHYSLPAWLKPKQEIKFLDAFAGAVTLIIWLAASGWILSTYSLSWGIVAGLGVLWLLFIIVFRLMIGGLLD